MLGLDMYQLDHHPLFRLVEDQLAVVLGMPM
jgi:hypothetical protein